MNDVTINVVCIYKHTAASFGSHRAEFKKEKDLEKTMDFRGRSGYSKFNKAGKLVKKDGGSAKRLAKALYSVLFGDDHSTHRQRRADGISYHHTFASNCAAPSLQGIL